MKTLTAKSSAGWERGGQVHVYWLVHYSLTDEDACVSDEIDGRSATDCSVMVGQVRICRIILGYFQDKL